MSRVIAIVQVGLFAMPVENNTSPLKLVIETAEPEDDGFAWSAWGSWGPCSRTCGGGVSTQYRQCLRRNRALSNSLTAVEDEGTDGDCIGSPWRYHECNTAPCPDGAKNSREDQCASYNHRPFKGRFYSWVPYVDGKSPCTLNCRPVGQQFYASLSLVADGTPCTKPGFRAICVQGFCKVVGRESVLAAATTREVRCGRRLVSGLFSKPRLPLGYSYVTTVPRGACRLNVSEIISSDNYIALKVTNGSYIMNGEFAVSSPGTYEAAGARFVYSRIGKLDTIYTHGPIQSPVDIMILYTTPNPSIKYEYLTELLPDALDPYDESNTIPEELPTSSPKHIRRHHNLKPHQKIPSDNGRYDTEFLKSRKFIWKIVNFSQCTRTCGGGIQIGKFRCVERLPGKDREVSSVHCSGSAPQTRRRRCGSGQCPPRWRAAAWSSCPQCGPATKTRIVGCVQDHSKGITKVNDYKCPAPKPATSEVCDIPDCDAGPPISSRKSQDDDEIEAFQDSSVYSVRVSGSEDIGPEYSFSAPVGWLYSEWSPCVGWCVGNGIQTRSIRCADPAGCLSQYAPETHRECIPSVSCDTFEGQWFTGSWSNCSSPCGGKRVRGVLCIGGSGRHLKDSACRDPKPETLQDCEEDCQPSWYYSDWTQCTGKCEQTGDSGIQRRTVWCAKNDTGAIPDSECEPPKPLEQQTCALTTCTTSSTANTLEYSEPQRVARNEIDVTTSASTTFGNENTKDCEDNLRTCALAVQARLCHYKYYLHNCCNSCKSR